jgi:hypothetical protein
MVCVGGDRAMIMKRKKYLVKLRKLKAGWS